MEPPVDGITTPGSAGTGHHDLAHAQPTIPLAVTPNRTGALALRLIIAGAIVGGGAWYLTTRGSHGGHDHAAGGSASGGGGRAGGGGSSDRIVPVTVTPVLQQDMPIWIEGLGAVAAVQQVTVHVLVSGILEKVNFVEGQFVHAGDSLAQVDPRPFEAALGSAEGALIRDKAQLVMNQQNLARYQGLADQKLVAATTVEQYVGQVGQFEGSVKSDQAAIDTAKLQLDYAKVKAPCDGITGVRQIDAGNLVQSTDATGLVVITAIDPAAVYFTIPEDRLPDVLEAQRHGEVKVSVSTRDNTQLLGEGTLLVLDNEVNQTTATLRLKALVKNPDHLLWPNAFVKARMLSEIRPNALVIPAVAIQQGPNNAPFVYIIKDGVATMTPIVVSLITGDTAIIDTGLTKGLTKGDQVVIEGQNQLRNNSHVDISGSAGSASGGSGGSGAGGDDSEGVNRHAGSKRGSASP